MAAGNPFLRILLGPDHAAIGTKLKDRSQRRAATRVQRRANKRGGASAQGQAAPQPQSGLRPPPPPAWDQPQQPGVAVYAPYSPTQHGPPASVPAAGPPQAAGTPDTDASTTQRIPGRASDDQAGTERVYPFGQSPTPPQPSATPQGSSAEQPWVPVDALPPEPWWVRVRRMGVLALAAIVGLAGVVTISDTVLRWVRPEPPPTAAPMVSDTQLAGQAAVLTTDYLSWDADNRAVRQSALARDTAPGAQIDGWDGTGRQWADSAAAVDVRRGEHNTAIVTVRVRVTPFTGAPTATQTADSGGGALASAPNLTASGATAAPPRWLNLAVPMSLQGARAVASAPPALVGSPPSLVGEPAVPGSALGDDQLAAATRETVGRLLGSYASGDLSYARASGTTFAGLEGAAQLGQVQQWRLGLPAPGTDPTRRRGDAIVTWSLAGGSGRLTSPYLVDLHQQDGRWYLAGISAETEDVAP